MLSGDVSQQHILMVAPDRPDIKAGLPQGQDRVQHPAAVRPAVNHVSQKIQPVTPAVQPDPAQ